MPYAVRCSLVLAIIANFGTQVASATPHECTLIETGTIGQTPIHFWNWEITGIDILKAEGLPKTEGSPAGIAILEDGLELNAIPDGKVSPSLQTNLPLNGSILGSSPAHGTSVGNLILNSRVALGGNNQLVAFEEVPCEFLPGWQTSDTDFYPDHYQGDPVRIRCDFTQAIAAIKKSAAKLVNLSGAMGSWKKAEQQLKSVDTIIVTSAGNDPTDPKYPTDSLKFRVPSIVVGALDRFGKRSGSWGDVVSILAPYTTPTIESVKNEGEGPQFGMTSGAAAFVTNSLSNVVAMLPEMNLEIAELLIDLTATPTKADRKLINSYRLIRASIDLRAELLSQRLELNNSNMKKALMKKNFSNFKSEAEQSFHMASTLVQATDCRKQAAGIRLMRKAFLLDPQEKYRSSITKFYDEQIRKRSDQPESMETTWMVESRDVWKSL